MEKQKYIELQYLALREEILQCRTRLFAIITGGSAIVPAIQMIADYYHAGVINLVLPIIVVVLIFLFISENNALMRAGLYIRKHIEPCVQEYIGWETWLETNKDISPRRVDRYLNYSFYLVSTLYYAGGVYLACNFAYSRLLPTFFVLLAVFYVLVGLVVLFIVIKRVLINTSF